MKIDQVDEKWSEKYKRSIDCDNPKGFSQRAHCDGRKKTNEDIMPPVADIAAMAAVAGMSAPIMKGILKTAYKTGKGFLQLRKIAHKAGVKLADRVIGEELYDFDKDEPMKSTVAVPGYGTMNIDTLMNNVINQTTNLLKQMQQGTQGFRNADYEINRNRVLPTKIAALVQALDDLQAIRAKGGARSRNIQKESFIIEDGWFDYYKKIASMSDPIKPFIRNTFTDQHGNRLDPNNKDHVKSIGDANRTALRQISQNVGNAIDTPGWQVKMFTPKDTLDKWGITKDELPKVIALRDKFKAEHPKAFELIRTGQADKAWELMRNESIAESRLDENPINDGGLNET